MSLLVKDILQIGKTQLEAAGRMNPKLDAELLFCHMLNLDKARFFMSWGHELADSQCEAYFQLLERRASGVPLQHITGQQEFMGLQFAVSDKALIPRQDTETLVETALDMLKGKKRQKVLDLCTGSGAIAISLDRQCATSGIKVKLDITASDLSVDALSLAKKNAAALGAGSIAFVRGDLFKPFQKKLGNVKFDMILSNPPYIKTDVISTLQTEVKDHEPLMALDGGKDGLSYYKRILTEAPSHLKKKGTMLLEIGWDQGDAIQTLAAEAGAYQSAEICKDLAGRDRVAILQV